MELASVERRQQALEAVVIAWSWRAVTAGPRCDLVPICARAEAVSDTVRAERIDDIAAHDRPGSMHVGRSAYDGHVVDDAWSLCAEQALSHIRTTPPRHPIA